MNENESQITRRGFLGVVGIAGVGVGMGIGGGLGPQVEAVEARPVKIADDQIIVGLDIGTSKICVVVANAEASGTMSIIGVGQAASRGVRQGEIIDFDFASDSITKALVNAQQMSDVMIQNVYLGVTGSFMLSFNNRGLVLIPEGQEKITKTDYDNVCADARLVSIFPENMFLHCIPKHYYLDGRQTVCNPVGMKARQIEADFHFVHGIGSRIKIPVRCVKGIRLDVEDVVFNPLASAATVLDADERTRGVLVVDMGGGTTDYALYADGALQDSGCKDFGGMDISYGIARALQIPPFCAERLKIQEGNVEQRVSPSGEMITLPAEGGFPGKEIESDTLNSIIRSSLRDMFERLKQRIGPTWLRPDVLASGIQLTGGCSLLKGMDELVEEVFGIPAYRARTKGIFGPASVIEDPQYACAIGLVKWAHDRSSGQSPTSAGESKKPRSDV